VANLVLDGNSLATYGVTQASSTAPVVLNVKATGCTTYGFYCNGLYRRCLATGNAAGFNMLGGISAVECIAHANTGTGFTLAANSVAIYCLSYGNTGGGSHGFLGNAGGSSHLINCVAYDNDGDGFRIAFAGGAPGSMPRNCIFAGNGGYGFNYNSTGTPGSTTARNNAYYSNTSGARNNVPAGIGDVTLTGDPFTNAAAGDFSLNNTAGAGAACRAAGIPGYLPGGTTRGYQDIGAAQHADPASSAGNTFILCEG
jgi:hypothetical protein